MIAKIKKLLGVFPVTVTNAVYIDGTSETVADAMKRGTLGNIGKPATVAAEICGDYEEVSTTRRASHDCTIIGDELVGFDKPADGGAIFYHDRETLAFKQSITHNLTETNGKGLEMKSCDYKYGKLMVANGRAGYDPNFGMAYIFHDFSTWKDKGATITFANCGRYDTIDLTALGVKTYAFWGNGDDIVFVSCNLFNDVYRIQLARGTVQFDGGTYTAADADRYNGTYKVLNHWHQDGAFGQFAAHGGQYFNGSLYLATNDNTLCTVYKCVFDKDELRFIPINFDARVTNSDEIKYLYIDGMCIDKDGRMIMQPLNGTGAGRVFMVAKVI